MKPIISNWMLMSPIGKVKKRKNAWDLRKNIKESIMSKVKSWELSRDKVSSAIGKVKENRMKNKKRGMSSSLSGMVI